MTKKVLFVITAFIAFFLAINYRPIGLYLNYKFAHSEANETTKTSDTDKQTTTLPRDTLYIPKLGVKAPIIHVEQENEEIFQQALQNGVVLYPGTPEIGEYGNPYIFGHSSDSAWSKGSYKTVFTLLTELKTGDEIIATNSAGDEYSYFVTKTAVISNTDFSYLKSQETDQKKLTLQTSYPIGTSLKRFIVVANGK